MKKHVNSQIQEYTNNFAELQAAFNGRAIDIKISVFCILDKTDNLGE
jgi:hypothetical protein